MKSNKKQAGKVALITGAARRIGAAIASALHEAGFAVAIHCYTHQEAGEHLAAELNQQRAGSARIFCKDLGLESGCAQLIAAVVDWAGRLDVLVNNASLFVPDTLLENNSPLQLQLHTVNVLAPWALSQQAAPFLSALQGNIINITDIHAETPLKGYTGYCMSKAALSLQTKALARALAPAVRVNAVAPGAIAWPEGNNALSHTLKAAILEKTPLKRHGTPASIAQAVLALIYNPFITGQVLAVDGGRSI